MPVSSTGLSPHATYTACSGPSISKVNRKHCRAPGNSRSLHNALIATPSRSPLSYLPLPYRSQVPAAPDDEPPWRPRWIMRTKSRTSRSCAGVQSTNAAVIS